MPTTRDRGIRSIFVTAMEMETKPATRWERLRDALDAELWRHVAIGSLSGLVLAVTGFGGLLALTPRDAGAQPEPEPAPVARFVSVDVTKADRQPVIGGKLAAVAIAPTFAERTAGDISVALAPGAVTLDEPIAYAGQTSPAGAALAVDRMFDQPRVVTASLGDASITPPAIMPDAAAPAVVEDDDDSNIIPVPRARPQVAAPPLPSVLPRPRPNLPVAAIVPPPEPPQAVTAAPTEPPPGLRPASGTLLGFFSTPNDPAKPSPQSRSISIDTPFGVPYVLQQGSVETACLKPELVEILRRIEGRYNKKVVITSGFRDRGRQGSLHRSCAAADIEVPGVDAASLASFARTIPEIGGVGTYCHQHMIHVDIGTPRDWKYGCGSYFAMRGGAPGKWGKVPGNLARNGMTGMSGMSGDSAED